MGKTENLLKRGGFGDDKRGRGRGRGRESGTLDVGLTSSGTYTVAYLRCAFDDMWFNFETRVKYEME